MVDSLILYSIFDFTGDLYAEHTISDYMLEFLFLFLWFVYQCSGLYYTCMLIGFIFIFLLIWFEQWTLKSGLFLFKIIFVNGSCNCSLLLPTLGLKITILFVCDFV